MGQSNRPRDRNILEGDIVVTAVAGHYAIGRILADRESQEFLESQEKWATTLRRACALAGTEHRVSFTRARAQPTLAKSTAASSNISPRYHAR